ncbi:hypothetical protein GS504_15490 [Rhodococcus hoagii]|uniref:polysaccharide pyruvyl transferase family protein n=1 Tax=Rhodococcus hoagii TaxID=43767 RepID=UPI000A11C723|nr:polysaccharide pyruvyl transferase family protein [Prescottella equi]NKR32304.1 hypothetical protein [Prescottella equi]NKS58862.1 hypothetical protein [Prescottella equi]NKS69107.1 hypothetical protein [Prescottella equi]
MDYIEKMKSTAAEKYAELYRDVTELVYVDFPDYPNVGDSAIALGQYKFFSESGISVRRTYCIGTLGKSVYRSRIPVVINGGGNIAGFFEGIDRHRNGLATKLRRSTLLIQAPQSIHFNHDQARREFVDKFASRHSLRMSVRETEGVAKLSDVVQSVLLAPDAVHHLGSITAPDPVARVAVLARRDRESAGVGTVPDSFDWPRDPFPLSYQTSLRWKTKYMGPVGQLLNPSVGRWGDIATERFRRGVELLSTGEYVITDRLHAMLIALQMGRPVVAVDNNNRKLTKYAETWFGATQPNLKFAESFESAMKVKISA